VSPTVIPVRELGLIGWLAAALFAVLAIASYSPADPSFSLASSGGEVSNLVGRSGAWFADLMFYLFGWPAWLLPIAFTVSGIRLIRSRDEPLHWPLIAWRIGGWFALLLASCILLHMHFVSSGRLPAGLGGILGTWLVEVGVPVLGALGLTLGALLLLLLGAQTSFGFSWLQVAEATGRGLHRLIARMLEGLERRETVKEAERAARTSAEQAREARHERLQEDRKKRAARKAPEIKAPAPAAVKKPARQQRLFDTRAAGELPDLELLDEPRPEDGGGYSEASLEKISQLLESKLRDFGVEAEVVSVLPGPVVTRFELQPAPGVKVQKISSLAKDLARSLAVISVRIVEVIPNKPYVGIEIPNEDRQVVRLKEILASPAFQESKSPVTLSLGKDIAGEPVVAHAASAGRRYHGGRQVGRRQRDAAVAALQVDAGRGAADPGRPEDARAVGL
jgi:S-DNA-T family DNA segregation ATPase FtsK/SpoIIIE